jgi:hypothetical protein
MAAALTARAQDRAEVGGMADAHSDVVRAHDLAQRHHLSQNWMVSGWCIALRRQVDEEWDEAEQQIADLETFQATLAMAGVGIGLAQLANLRDLTGRLPDLEPVLRRAAPFHVAIRELHALAPGARGRARGGRLRIGPYPEQPAFSFDYMWLPFMAVRAEVWSALGTARRPPTCTSSSRRTPTARHLRARRLPRQHAADPGPARRSHGRPVGSAKAPAKRPGSARGPRAPGLGRPDGR